MGTMKNATLFGRSFLQLPTNPFQKSIKMLKIVVHRECGPHGNVRQSDKEFEGKFKGEIFAIFSVIQRCSHLKINSICKIQYSRM